MLIASVDRMGELERMLLGAVICVPTIDQSLIARDLSLHAMRLSSPQIGYTHIQGQIFEYG